MSGNAGVRIRYEAISSSESEEIRRGPARGGLSKPDTIPYQAGDISGLSRCEAIKLNLAKMDHKRGIPSTIASSHLTPDKNLRAYQMRPLFGGAHAP